ncbi:phosphonate C-P lyase system protein PhnH [Rhizobium sp. BK068]|uniref:phosphonate C-P lyase system protein PhnH n=1 Tax=Rhizobium sp. BK068 TaxID=2512130 RepID=UPI00104AAB7C|nr:phosphonate C-P lyase system protein PhnH [Rhizobium sp. BK068]TCM76717.1 alpha-D-ribose 1-methylphosphonate 5-triphosphate synthase subunit PhnH [Rhizobium sp. BK068]
MTNALQPTAEDMRTNATFEELMWALSRPGLVRALPSSGLAAIGESLLDRECSFAVLHDLDVAQALGRTGARAAALPDADYVFATADTREKASAFASLRIGTLAYPDHAATLFVPAKFGFGSRLRLAGPGVKDSVTIAIDGIDPRFWQVRAEAMRYPLGWDVYLVDGDRVIGLPRSTKIEVL